MAWLSGYSKRKKVTLTGGASGAQTDYQIKLVIPYNNDMQINFDDLRFTKIDGITLIDAWLEEKTNSISATVWVEFPTTPINTVEQDYYMYYGNSSVTSNWDLGSTFIFADDFEDGTLDAWQQTTNGSISGTAHSGSYSALSSKACCSTAYADRIISNNFTSVHNCIFDFWVKESAKQPFIYLYEDSNNFIELRIDCEPHGSMLTAFYLTEGGSLIGNSPNGGDFPKNTWYHCKIVIDGDSAKLYLDTTDATTLKSTYTISNIQNLDFVNFQFVARGGNTYIDDLKIRKYVTNPSTYGLGSEEIESWTIVINGTKQSDFQMVKVLDTIAGSKKFDIIFNGSEKDQIFNHYDDIEIYGESKNIIFKGRIEEIIPDYINDTTIISGRDYVAELMDKYVVEHYDAKLRSFIIDDLLEKHSSHITRSHIESSPIGSEYTHTFKLSVWDVLIECAIDDEYKFWVDVNNDFHYTPKGYTDSGMTLILGTDDILSFNIEESSKDIINNVTVFGGGIPQIIIQQDDLDSQLYYEIIKSKQIFDDSIDTNELAEIKANNYLAENAWVLDMITFEVDGYETLNAGELITVTLSRHNIDGTYLVIDKQHEFPSGITTIRVARYEKNLETIISSLVSRLNNLEQQTAITARIQKVYEQQGYSDTLKIYSKVIGSSFRLGVTGHCELGKINLIDNSGVEVLEYSGS